MNQQSDANSREKSLGENVMIIALIALLMGSFIYYFLKQEQQITNVGFNTVASNFAAKVTALRAQWFMDNQPDVMVIKEQNGARYSIRLNANGWVDFIDDIDNCRKVWQAVISDDLTFMNRPVAVIEIKNEQNRLKNACRFSLPTGESFDYFFESGKVIMNDGE